MATSETSLAIWLAIAAGVQTFIGMLITIIGWFGARTLKSVESSIKVLFRHHEDLEKDHNSLRSEFDTLKGEHNHEMLNGGRRVYDPPLRPGAHQ
jgi:hypothetical protein